MDTMDTSESEEPLDSLFGIQELEPRLASSPDDLRLRFGSGGSGGMGSGHVPHIRIGGSGGSGT